MRRNIPFYVNASKRYLTSVLCKQHDNWTILKFLDGLLVELRKKSDNKQLFVEIHLMDKKIYPALHAVPKAKATLIVSCNCASAIYVTPTLWANIDIMSGKLHYEELDYNIAHSYFLEVFK